MNNGTLEAVTDELLSVLPGRKFGRVFPLSRRSFAVDLRLPGSRYLFIAAEASDPRVYLIRRRLKDLERSAQNPNSFHLLLKKRLASSTVDRVDKPRDERILFVRFRGTDEVDELSTSTLVVQMTGKSSNVFVLDDLGIILNSLIDKDIDGQRVGEKYSQPLRTQISAKGDQVEIEKQNGSISDALDEMYQQRAADERFSSQAENARRELRQELVKREKLITRLRDDLKSHGDAETWKRYGDIILANLSTAQRVGDKILVIDYFQEDAPQIEIEAQDNESLSETAQKYFRRYTKAQHATTEIGKRIRALVGEITLLRQKQIELEKAIQERDESYFSPSKQSPKAKEKKEKEKFSGARQFRSSDGFEILVGKRAADNDQLTFRIAGPVDLWLHAADYSGSHVVIRNPNRAEVPHTTLLEAAQLAAFYSSGKSQPKAAVHYTQKKFVNKAKGAAPGLVRLASFKTILVEPSIPEALDQKTKI